MTSSWRLLQTVAVAGFVPIYSGGTARAFHPLPLPRNHNVRGTIGESDKTCQVATAPPLVTVRQAVVACARNLRIDLVGRSSPVAFQCEICLKKPASGNNVSHANNKTRRVFNPNIQTVRAKVGGANKRIRVCTRCLRSGLVTKAV